jgi:hypothetical protein
VVAGTASAFGAAATESVTARVGSPAADLVAIRPTVSTRARRKISKDSTDFKDFMGVARAYRISALAQGI